jgi:hypothetical protein
MLDNMDAFEAHLKALKPKVKRVRESSIEDKHVASVVSRGGMSPKFVSPGFNGVPDRLDLFPIPFEHRAIVARYFRFTELKAPGKKPRPDQLRVHKMLRDLGFTVDVIDSKPEDLFK